MNKIAVLFFLLGISFGLCVKAVLDAGFVDINSMEKWIQTASALATMLGVFGAFVALGSWKKQQVYSKRDELIDHVEDEFCELYGSIAQLHHTRLMMAKSEANNKSSPNESLREEEDSKKDIYYEMRRLYKFAFIRLVRHVDIDEESCIRPGKIDSDAASIFQAVYSVYTQSDIHESDRLLSENYDNLESLFERRLQAFKDIREAYLS